MKLSLFKRFCKGKRNLTFRFGLMPMIIGWIIIESVTTSMAVPGDLDPTFGSGGKVITSVRGYISEAGTSTALQADGKIVVAGSSGDGFMGSDWDFAVVRYNPDGTFDTTFGVGGKITTPVSDSIDLANSVAIQPDGKIVVAGIALPIGRQADFAVVRYNSDGSLDTSFDGDGKVITPIGNAPDGATSVKIQDDGKIIVVGFSGGTTDSQDLAVVRLNSNGSLDTTFDGDGIVLTNTGSIADYAHSVAIQSDGKIVVGGVGGNGFKIMPAVVRYNSNGSLDATFGNNGIVTTPILSQVDELYEIAIQPDGKIVGIGRVNTPAPVSSDFLVVRYNINGSLDSSFDGDGIVITAISNSNDSASSIAIQANGKIVVAGGSVGNGNIDFAAARYNSNGSLDSSFGNGGIVITPMSTTSDDSAASVVIQPNGKIILAGATSEGFRSYFALVRYQGDSTTSGQPLFDFDGDRKTDISVFRSINGIWHLNRSQAGFTAVPFGLPSDLIAPADYDGDGKTDIAVFRKSEGTWYGLRSSDGSFFAAQFGQNGDSPRPADFDGDGKADLTVFRRSNGFWYRLNSSNNQFVASQFGLNGDAPLVADFDGDGKSDIAVWRSGVWYWLNSSNGQFSAVQFGLNTDIPAVGDYDGDGRADVSVFRPQTGTWYRMNSSNGQFVSVQFGQSGDTPTVGDYDGDGKSDIAVWRPSNRVWYRLNSSNGQFFDVPFGLNGDKPVPAAFLSSCQFAICIASP